MNDIIHEALDNLGGSDRTLYVLPFDEVPSYTINKKENTITSSLQLVNWKKIEFTMDTLSFEEQEENTPQGDIYSKLLSGSIPKDRKEVNSILRFYHRKRVVVVHTDRNGVRRLLGTKEHPCILSFNTSTGPSMGDQNKFSLKIQQADNSPAPYYSIE